jgi:hypothetical protein
MGTGLGDLSTETPIGGLNPVVGKNNFDLQNQAVASINSPSMEIKHLLSWTWAQCASNQQTSIAILIKGKLKLIKNFRLMGDPWAQLAPRQLKGQAQFEHEYVNSTNVGHVH